MCDHPVHSLNSSPAPLLRRRAFLQLAAAAPVLAAAPAARTEVSIHGEQFYINGKPTYAGRSWNGHKIEGLLMNVRAVQATYDDLNPATRTRWAYPDTHQWDAERNLSEFLAVLPEWRRHGLLAFTVNLQGGSPEGYSKGQPWENTAFEPDGSLRPAYLKRLSRVLERADELGMVVIVGYFYFGQDQRVKDEASVRRAVTNATNWLLDSGRLNILVEIDNECNIPDYDHDILKPARVHELIELAKSLNRNGRRLLTGTSYGGGTPATGNVVKASDFLLLHGNGPEDPARIHRMIRASRAVPEWRPMPVLINEDDHFRFGDADNHLEAALSEYVSWGYFDPRQERLFRRLSVPAGELGAEHRTQARLLHQAQGDHRSMNAHRIALLPGDGIGPEVVAAAVEVLGVVAPELKYEEFSVGAGEYLRGSDPLPPATFDRLREFDAILLGAMGLPGVRGPAGIEMTPQLDLRERLDLYCGLRPVYLFHSDDSPLRGRAAGSIDIMLVRESTEGLFSTRLRTPDAASGCVEDVMRVTRAGAERVVRSAFRQALGRRGRVALVDKANVLPSMAFFRSVFQAVAAEFPNVSTECVYVDAAALYLVTQPERFDVMVTENMFGDILSDLLAGLVGGMGMAPSADIGDRYAVFQPSHGSAPDIAGQGAANPVATILSAAMMLNWLGQPEAGGRIESAVRRVFAGRERRTRDMGGRLSTSEMTRAILSELP